jgi:hypothetical protein
MRLLKRREETMLKIVSLGLALTLVLSSGPADAQSEFDPKAVFGSWTGIQTTDQGRERQATLVIREDGTWEITVHGRNRSVSGNGTFRVEKGQVIWKSGTTGRTGKWTVTGDRLSSTSDDGERRAEYSRVR